MARNLRVVCLDAYRGLWLHTIGAICDLEKWMTWGRLCQGVSSKKRPTRTPLMQQHGRNTCNTLALTPTPPSGPFSRSQGRPSSANKQGGALQYVSLPARGILVRWPLSTSQCQIFLQMATCTVPPMGSRLEQCAPPPPPPLSLPIHPGGRDVPNRWNKIPGDPWTPARAHGRGDRGRECYKGWLRRPRRREVRRR